MNTTKPFPLPTGYFGIPLGLAALALAWRHLSHLLPWAEGVQYVRKCCHFRLCVFKYYDCVIGFNDLV